MSDGGAEYHGHPTITHAEEDRAENGDYVRRRDANHQGANTDEEKNTIQTCFAILFLKKATRAIATGDRK